MHATPLMNGAMPRGYCGGEADWGAGGISGLAPIGRKTLVTT
jgi:hypothetical protein